MNVTQKIVLSVAGFIGLVVLVGVALPRTAHVERSIDIDAPPSMVFAVLNGFGQFQQWSPWADLDPEMRTSLEGPAAGVGAKLSWSGNSDAGSGSQEIVESVPYERIRVRLVLGDFGGEFHGTYSLTPQGTGTHLTWAFDADYGNNLMGRYFGLFADGLVGADYEKGLARLKSFVEGLPPTDFSKLDITVVETRAEPVVLMTTHSPADFKAVGVALGVAYGRLSGFMSSHGVKQAGPPIAIYHGEQNGALSFDAAIPVDRTDVKPDAGIRTGSTYAGRAVRAVYRGPYSGLAAARHAIASYLEMSGLQQGGAMWEQYVSDPGKTPDAELVTHLYYPIQ
jgi:effector-binding domain-containing protein